MATTRKPADTKDAVADQTKVATPDTTKAVENNEPVDPHIGVQVDGDVDEIGFSDAGVYKVVDGVITKRLRG